MNDLVTQAFRISLRLPDNFDLRDEHKFMDVPGWDSVGHMALVAELEKQAQVAFELDEIVAMVSVQAIRDLLEKKGLHGHRPANAC